MASNATARACVLVALAPFATGCWANASAHAEAPFGRAGARLALAGNLASDAMPRAASTSDAAASFGGADDVKGAPSELSRPSGEVDPGERREQPVDTSIVDPGERRDRPVDALQRGSSSRCPSEMTLVAERVCVDRWEASLVLRTKPATAWSPYLAIDGHEGEVRAVSRAGVVPQAYVSGKQGDLACRASGKRLCSADEWQLACRGPAQTTFPYGAERRHGVCNDDVRPVHPVAEIGFQRGWSAVEMWSEGMNDPMIDQLPGTLLEAGARADCTNGYGVFDMVGNLHEWIDDPAGTFRGGYFMDTTKNGDGCEYETTAHDFAYHDYSTGFRCCMDPDRVE